MWLWSSLRSSLKSYLSVRCDVHNCGAAMFHDLSCYDCGGFGGDRRMGGDSCDDGGVVDGGWQDVNDCECCCGCVVWS